MTNLVIDGFFLNSMLCGHKQCLYKPYAKGLFHTVASYETNFMYMSDILLEQMNKWS